MGVDFVIILNCRRMVQMKYFTVSDTGKVRENNEDYIAVFKNHQLYGIDSIETEKQGLLFILCDGMGGLRGGEVASRMACEMLMREYYLSDHYPDDPGYMISVMIKDISRKIMIHGLNNTELYGMGTTLVSLVVKDDKSYINSVGDSRLYSFRNNTLKQITEDQSLVWQLYKKGVLTKEEIRVHPESNIVTYAVGAETYLTAENVNRYTIDNNPEDIFLICSDGLSDSVPERTIQDIMGEDDGIEIKAEKLLKEALDAGGKDNISMILVKV